MATIVSTNPETGNKEIIEYSKTIIPQKEHKPFIVITDDDKGYEIFKMCVQESKKQSEYVGGGDKRYAEAIGYLSARNHELFEKFYKCMKDELKRSDTNC